MIDRNCETTFVFLILITMLTVLSFLPFFSCKGRGMPELPVMWGATVIPGRPAANIRILREGSVYLNRDWVVDLRSSLMKLPGSGTGERIFVFADARVRYQTIRETVEIVRDAGFTRVVLITDADDGVICVNSLLLSQDRGPLSGESQY